MILKFQANVQCDKIQPPEVVIRYLSGKVAASSGDVRKALDVLRRAMELCEVQTKRLLIGNKEGD